MSTGRTPRRSDTRPVLFQFALAGLAASLVATRSSPVVSSGTGSAMLLRKMLSAGPLRITVSRKGVSQSVGGSWWRVQTGGARPHYTVRIPGTGVSIHRTIRRKK
jgi:hypothetical protein